MFKPPGLIENLPPGVDIVGDTVDMSLIQYDLAGYLKSELALKSLIVKANIPEQSPEEYSIVYEAKAERLVSISPVRGLMSNPVGLDVNVPPGNNIVGVTVPKVVLQ